MKGSVYVWLMALTGLFVVSLIWIIFSNVMFDHLFPLVSNATAANPDAQATIGYLQTAWSYWPVILLVGFILLMIVSAQRREPEQYGYYT